MKGTEKQVKWAEDIKASFIENATAEAARLEAKGAERGNKQMLAKAEEIRQGMERALNQPVTKDAVFWINRRSISVEGIIRDADKGKVSV